ncbi:hypothetical protein [Alkalimarinus alittae]|uniref:Uncharacterized protein n=1 Tax=Alkalimarinus alittae TaxID=2961619 RepID=A0ABY6N6Z7_9ALTE|nr:hypothetical protein [Alkalimarinus alittae]UZE97910.1 hypothetical protein NKI27_09310 [Alkalimarinus alittae]
MKKLAIPTALISVTALISGCGGGSSTPAPSPEPSINQGQFIDSAVANLRYVTDSQEAYTDEQGYFDYLEGETIRFYIGNIYLGESLGKAIVTPLDLFTTDSDIASTSALNAIQLLQSLDENQDVSDGIKIPQAIHNLASGMSIDFSDSASVFSLDEDVIELINHLGINSLVDRSGAKKHFSESLENFGITYTDTFKSLSAPNFELLTAFYDEQLISYSYENNALATVVEDQLAPEYTLKPLVLNIETGSLDNNIIISQDDKKLVAFNRTDGSLRNLSGQGSSTPCYYAKSFVSTSNDLTFTQLSGEDGLCGIGGDDYIARILIDDSENDEVVPTELDITPTGALYDYSGQVSLMYGGKTDGTTGRVGFVDANLDSGTELDLRSLIQTGPKGESQSAIYALANRDRSLYLVTAEDLLQSGYQLPGTPIFSAETSIYLPTFNQLGTNISLFFADSAVYQVDRTDLSINKLFDIEEKTSVTDISLHGDYLIFEIRDISDISDFKDHIYSYNLSTRAFSPIFEDKYHGHIHVHGDVLAVSYRDSNSTSINEATVSLFDRNLDIAQNITNAQLKPYFDLTSNSHSLLIEQNLNTSESTAFDIRLYSISKDNGALREILILGDVTDTSVSDAQDEKLHVIAKGGTNSRLHQVSLVEMATQSTNLPEYSLSPIHGRLY